ncbi:flagellar hook assembly protein FlgD [Nocardioides sp. R-C-SC26]|uniref:flagellar hook assembly protein FlgD n=1 Tax=Nocardioides sp. R-C-SC26 TaxID=2870414 RepID=UPI001E3F7C32|nr:flagellar hook capping FlgD N-terminal domain-containing protein [Nocardioides sp. R-C-SC26]
MPVPATSSVTASGLGSLIAPATSSGTGKTSSSDDKQMFMELMVAQLRYQDPLNPADTGEFLSQTAQFNALEQMQKVAEQSALVLSSTLAFGAAGLVGREVSFTTADGKTASGPVESVTFGVDGPMLSVGEHQVPLASVQSVRAPTEADDTTATGPTPAATDSTTGL